MRKEGEDLSPPHWQENAGPNAEAAPGWQSVPDELGCWYDELRPRSSMAGGLMCFIPCHAVRALTGLSNGRCFRAGAGAGSAECRNGEPSCRCVAFRGSDQLPGQRMAKTAGLVLRHLGGPVRSAAAECPVS